MQHTPGHIGSGGRTVRQRTSALGIGTGLLLATLTGGSGSPAHAAQVETVNYILTISYAPNSYVIGNAYPGWTDVIQGPPQGGGNGINYRWGYLYGPRFDSCAWIPANGSTATAPASNMCGSPQQQDTPYFVARYTNGTVSPKINDGSPTTRTGAAGCDIGYGNVEPWRVPAVPGSPRALAASDPLLWRYISADSNWVMVRDRVLTPNTPNWFFVPRGCINLL